MRVHKWFPLLEYSAFPSKAGIYIIRNKLNGMEYVGISTSIAKRLTVHRCGKANNSLLHRAINKYGKDCFEVAYLCLPIAELNAVEREVIASRCTLAPRGYNLTVGGEGVSGWVQPQSQKDKISKANTGKRHSEETRKRLREIKLNENKLRPRFKHSQETRDKLSALRRARGPISEQTRQAMSKAHLGKKLAESTKLAISASNKGRVLLDTTKAAMIAATRGIKLTEAHRTKLSEAMRGKEYSEETKNKAHATRRRRADPNLKNYVFVWEKDASVAKTFKNFKEAACYLKVRENTLREWCRIGAPKYLELAVAREYL